MIKKSMAKNRILYGLAALFIVIATYPSFVSAAQISGRNIVLGSSAASVNTSYAFNFTVPTSTIIRSASFTACTTASGACTTPAGFAIGSASLSVQPVNLGDASGWTINTSTAGSLRIVNSANSSAPSASQSVSFASVTNPSAANDTFYIRIVTFSDNAWTTPIDNGVVATSTAGQVTVSVIIDEKISFALASTTVSLTQPSTVTTGLGTSAMTISTNASSGYSINYNGPTLTSGANTIDAMTVAGPSVVNSRQFGINLMSNTTPTVGSSTTGSGSGLPAAGYNVIDEFKFDTAGDVIATASAPTNNNTYTASYIVNTDGSTAAGAYSTILTYTATANF